MTQQILSIYAFTFLKSLKQSETTVTRALVNILCLSGQCTFISSNKKLSTSWMYRI